MREAQKDLLARADRNVLTRVAHARDMSGRSP
jgi:hypothetical protein